MIFQTQTILALHAPPVWMTSLDDNAPAVAVSCTLVLLLAVFAFTMLVMKRRDLAAIQEADGKFVAAFQNAPHVLGVYQDQTSFGGSPRWQIYLAACRELCFYLLGTDQVEKNFPTRLRAAGRIMPSQMSAISRASRLASGECILALHSLAPGSFLSGLLLPFVGLLGSLAVILTIILRQPGPDLDLAHVALPVVAPFMVSILALLVLLPVARNLDGRLKAHEARLQLFPLSLATVLERVFVDHRQSLEELPSVAALGTPDRPSFSLPPTGPGNRTAL